MRGQLRAAALRRRSQHHPLLDAGGAGEHRLERRVDLLERHFGQESEAAEVDADDRDVDAGRPDRVSHRQQRAVAAENDDRVDALHERGLVDDAPGRRRGHERSGRRFEGDGDAARTEPLLDLDQVRRRLAQVRLRDDADGVRHGRAQS